MGVDDTMLSGSGLSRICHAGLWIVLIQDKKRTPRGVMGSEFDGGQGQNRTADTTIFRYAV